MRSFIIGFLLALIAVVAGAVVAYYQMLPRANWAADQDPPKWERRLANGVIDGWVERNAGTATNPMQATPENLKSARSEYNEHCAACHGVDGTAKNQFEADFYPPVPKLTSEWAQRMADSQMYFIIAKG